jgi:hypothetical protein
LLIEQVGLAKIERYQTGIEMESYLTSIARLTI